jgi:glycosyltransferase involved in cell wall biosynthesis
MRILIVTDAWRPQMNGVVRTLKAVRAELEALGHQVGIISPDRFSSLPCPTYPEIRLALAGERSVGRLIDEAAPHAIHIATEGPLGLAARAWCMRRTLPFTTAFHTHFPEYAAARTGLSSRHFWRYLTWFHRPAQSVLVSTATLARQLAEHGLPRISFWGRGVDLDLFGPDVPLHPDLRRLPRPLLLYVGRIAVEKNVEAFLGSSHPASKVVVGDGPALRQLKRDHPTVSFMGALRGVELASAYRSADVLVFPSRTDTFGLVMVEALACGTPVAAFPVPGPIDILTDKVGAMSEDLDEAIAGALQCDRGACADLGSRFSWRASAEQFLEALVPLPLAAAA